MGLYASIPLHKIVSAGMEAYSGMSMEAHTNLGTESRGTLPESSLLALRPIRFGGRAGAAAIRDDEPLEVIADK